MKLDVETHGCASLFLSTNFTNEHKYSPQPPIGIKCIYSINMKPLQDSMTRKIGYSGTKMKCNTNITLK
jgi:hypothetical protein